MEKKIETIEYSGQPLRYYRNGKDLCMNVQDLMTILHVNETALTTSKMEYVSIAIALGTAYEQKDNSFYTWLNQKFYGSGPTAADIIA
jgi:uncharacterized metal-binding protein